MQVNDLNFFFGNAQPWLLIPSLLSPSFSGYSLRGIWVLGSGLAIWLCGGRYLEAPSISYSIFLVSRWAFPFGTQVWSLTGELWSVVSSQLMLCGVTIHLLVVDMISSLLLVAVEHHVSAISSHPGPHLVVYYSVVPCWPTTGYDSAFLYGLECTM